MRKTIAFVLILIGSFFIAAQEKSEKNDNEIELEELSKETWNLVLRELKRDDLLFQTKMSLLTEFSQKVPESSKFSIEAKHFLKNIHDSPKRLEHLTNKELYKSKTEWFAASFVGGNYGLGCSLSFFTLRWGNFFWEAMRIQFTMLLPLSTYALNGKTMIGIAAFFGYANQHEFRVSAGISGGMADHKIVFKKEIDYSSTNATIVDIDDFTTVLNIPFEISYVFHAQKNFAFQVGITVDFPVLFNGNGFQHDYYIPIISSFIGFRI